MDTETLTTDPYDYDDGYDRFVSKDCGRKIRYISAAYGIYANEFASMEGCESGSAVANWENGNMIPLRDKYYKGGLWGFGCRTGAFYLRQQYCSLPMEK